MRLRTNVLTLFPLVGALGCMSGDPSIDPAADVAAPSEATDPAPERAVAESGVGKGKFYTPLRDVLTGKKVALPIHYCFGLLPKEVALSRLERATRVTA